MKTERAHYGFILVTTLMILSLAMVLISFIINRSTVFFPLAQTMIEREKAKELALGGLQLASSQLAYADVTEKEEPQTQEKKITAKPNEQKQQANKSGAQEKQMFKTLAPILNRWQTVKLDFAKDGVDGEIKICIMSEDGKINLNELYDFQKHAFVGNDKEKTELKKALQEIFGTIKKASGSEGLFESLEAFLKERTDKIQDITELLTIKSFETFKNNIFYSPDRPTSHEKEKKSLYLTDIFTLWNHKRTLDPWLFSSSLRTILDLPEATADALKHFKASYSWPADWNNVFSKVYKKDFNSLPKGIATLLGSTFGPETFSVLSYGTVGQITHRLFAIVERDTADRESKEPAKVIIKKLYWI